MAKSPPEQAAALGATKTMVRQVMQASGFTARSLQPTSRHLSRGRRNFGRRLAKVFLAITSLALLSIPLEALAQTPTVSQISFAPTNIQSGRNSTLTITLGYANPNADAGTGATLTAALTDTLPAGLVIATPSGLGGTCTASGTVSAAAGGRSISFAAGSIIPLGGCTIQVSVTGTSTARSTYYTDSIGAGALQTDAGNNPTAASGTLTVRSVVTVPNVHGLSQAAAAAALQAAGLALGTVSSSPGNASTPYNTVLRQTLAAGASVTAGTAVGITLSTGAGLATNPNRPLTSVPNFVAPYQQSEAAALERVCAALQSANPASLSVAQGNLLANCTAIIGTYGGGVNAAGLKNTLSAISGMQTTAQQRVGVQFAGAQFTNIGSRLAQLRQGVAGASFSGLDLGLPAGSDLSELFAALRDATGYKGNLGSLASSGGGAGDADSSVSASTRLGFFINGSLRRGTQDTTTYESPFDFSATNITAGVDFRFTDHIVLGLALGHSNGSTEFTDGSGRLDSRTNLVSLYGTYYREAFYVDLIGTFGHVAYAATRTTSFAINASTQDAPSNCVASECSVDTNGSTGARQLAFDGNVGYSFNNGALTWGPDVALNYTHINVNGFTENDPNSTGLGLSFGDDIGESLIAKAGGHLAYAIKTPYAVILPEARAHYIHEFKNDQRALSVHFSADPDAGTPAGPVSNFVVFSDSPNRSYFDWAAGFSAQFAFGIAAFADYNAISSTDQRLHEVTVGVRVEHQIP